MFLKYMLYPAQPPCIPIFLLGFKKLQNNLVLNKSGRGGGQLHSVAKDSRLTYSLLFDSKCN